MAPRKTAPPAAPSAVAVPTLNIQRVSMRVIGDSPLITHAWSQKAKKQMLDAQMRRARAPKAAKDPFRDFVESLYWLDEPGFAPPSDLTQEAWEDVVRVARFGVPSTAVKSAIVDAATFVESVTKVGLRGALHINGEMIHVIGTPTIREDMVRIGMGTADIRYRGEFREWSAAIEVQHNPNVVSVEQIAYLLNVAGFSCGVGEWRPQKNGSYGRFHVA